MLDNWFNPVDQVGIKISQQQSIRIKYQKSSLDELNCHLNFSHFLPFSFQSQLTQFTFSLNHHHHEDNHLNYLALCSSTIQRINKFSSLSSCGYKLRLFVTVSRMMMRKMIRMILILFSLNELAEREGER